ncbi:hypothetical protein M409DRAFT_63769 [Zasmidium cellare ATCC 36951]|uniref:Peptidase S9 prolyl oligopeptidase catalytic domain-containing protein n=1 Tax=Zasmidium cellare ATCC 36951 TaxID=1080233 RepID=A0A6A6CZB4_ZASCE|nr:uncharacterized protein M409DRAFT_63769 [Zasmidium cellare ATCC 36951]KAF2171540.1 hypothetical protein M409DRAFT_63769 [Zasmidium cellare ATCC 36951]
MLLVAGLAAGHGADLNDVLKTALYIEPGNFESFAEAFKDLADQTKAKADDTLLQSDAVNARDTYFAAATYYRAADLFLHGNCSDPRINEFWDLQTDCFNKGISALPVPGERITLKANGFKIPAIYYGPSQPVPNVKRPTLLLCEGYDAAQEELLHFNVFFPLSRGWNAITFEGPGQPTVRRNQDIGFIPDWERVVTPVVDYLYTRSDIDFERLALLGNSFGGYLTARAAAFEPRLKALILNGGIYDSHQAFVGQLPANLQALYDAGDKDQFDDLIGEALHSENAPSQFRWDVEQGLWAFKIQAYTIANITDRIRMPTFIANATDDQFFAGQPQLVKNALGDRATLYSFDGAAGYHTQVGASVESNRVIHMWLDSVFNMTSQAVAVY